MSKISIHLPPVDTDDKVEVTVVVNGKQRKYDYRMELFAWEEYATPNEKRAECLRRIVNGYDKEWSLVQIGEASDQEVSMLFERRSN
jgi:hypothetical protein